jgi:hypothetical protein
MHHETRSANFSLNSEYSIPAHSVIGKLDNESSDYTHVGQIEETSLSDQMGSIPARALLCILTTRS